MHITAVRVLDLYEELEETGTSETDNVSDEGAMLLTGLKYSMHYSADTIPRIG